MASLNAQPVFGALAHAMASGMAGTAEGDEWHGSLHLASEAVIDLPSFPLLGYAVWQLCTLASHG